MATRKQIGDSGAYEDKVKALVIDYQLEQLPSSFIVASEVPFSDLRRRVDLLTIGTELHAIEIKSSRDNLDRLGQQLDDYRTHFERVSIYCTAKHLNKVRDVVPKSVGIVVLDETDRSFSVIQTSQVRRRVTKESWAKFLYTDDLRRLLRANGYLGNRRAPIEELRKKLIDISSAEQIRSYALEALYQRYLGRFTQFLQERGAVTHQDDIQLLRMHHGAILS